MRSLKKITIGGSWLLLWLYKADFTVILKIQKIIIEKTFFWDYNQCFDGKEFKKVPIEINNSNQSNWTILLIIF